MVVPTAEQHALVYGPIRPASMRQDIINALLFLALTEQENQK